MSSPPLKTTDNFWKQWYATPITGIASCTHVINVEGLELSKKDMNPYLMNMERNI